MYYPVITKKTLKLYTYLRTEVKGDLCCYKPPVPLGQPKVQEAYSLHHRKFLTFDGKQHPKNIWFRGC